MGLGHQALVGLVIGQPGRLLGDQLGLAVDILTGPGGGSGFGRSASSSRRRTAKEGWSAAVRRTSSTPPPH